MKRVVSLFAAGMLAIGAAWAAATTAPTVPFAAVVERTPIDPRTGGALTPVLQGEHATVNVW